MTHTVQTPDGRSLELHEGGDPSGLPVIIHHGTPSSGLPYATWETPTRKPGRSIADAAADVEAIADALELDRFATWGISGGGPHALACIALCGDRLTAAASLAGVAPWDAEGLDYLAGMGEENVKEFDLVLAGEEALRPAVERDRVHMLETSAAQIQGVFASLLGAADQAVLTGVLA